MAEQNDTLDVARQNDVRILIVDERKVNRETRSKDVCARDRISVEVGVLESSERKERILEGLK